MDRQPLNLNAIKIHVDPNTGYRYIEANGEGSALYAQELVEYLESGDFSSFDYEVRKKTLEDISTSAFDPYFTDETIALSVTSLLWLHDVWRVSEDIDTTKFQDELKKLKQACGEDLDCNQSIEIVIRAEIALFGKSFLKD
jgi:hypothetical protein